MKKEKREQFDFFGLAGFTLVAISIFLDLVVLQDDVESATLEMGDNLYVFIIYIACALNGYAIISNRDLLKVFCNIVSLVCFTILSYTLFNVKSEYPDIMTVGTGYYVIIVGIILLIISTFLSFSKKNKTEKEFVSDNFSNLNSITNIEETPILVGRYIMGIKGISIYNPCLILLDDNFKQLKIFIKKDENNNHEFKINYSDIKRIDSKERIQMNTQKRKDDRFNYDVAFYVGLANANPLLAGLGLLGNNASSEELKVITYYQIELLYNYNDIEIKLIMETNNKPNDFISKINNIISTDKF